eukprot:213175-Chlamydomonas_euryale.AAC.1
MHTAVGAAGTSAPSCLAFSTANTRFKNNKKHKIPRFASAFYVSAQLCLLSSQTIAQQPNDRSAAERPPILPQLSYVVSA